MPNPTLSTLLGSTRNAALEVRYSRGTAIPILFSAQYSPGIIMVKTIFLRRCDRWVKIDKHDSGQYLQMVIGMVGCHLTSGMSSSNTRRSIQCSTCKLLIVWNEWLVKYPHLAMAMLACLYLYLSLSSRSQSRSTTTQGQFQWRIFEDDRESKIDWQIFQCSPSLDLRCGLTSNTVSSTAKGAMIWFQQ